MTDKIGLTERENIVYQAIVKFITENNYAPTVRELVSMTGIKSTASISACIDKLRRKGYINCKGRAARTISIKKQVTE